MYQTSNSYYKVMNTIPSNNKVSKHKINFILKNIEKCEHKFCKVSPKYVEIFRRQLEANRKFIFQNSNHKKKIKHNHDKKISLPMYNTVSYVLKMEFGILVVVLIIRAKQQMRTLNQNYHD